MTPAEALERIVPRWRASLPAKYSAEVDQFVGRRRQDLEALLAQVIGARHLRRGILPRTPADFTAVKFLAENERRPHYGPTDKDVAKRLRGRTKKLTAAANSPEARDALRQRVEEYVLVRAEALIMNQMGWDAMPLFLRRPLLAVYSASTVVIVHRHGADGSEEAIFPGLEDSVDDLKADLEIAREAATAIVKQIGHRRPERVWARARRRGAAVLRAERETEPQADLDAEDWFEAGELPKSADEFAAYRRFADEHRPDEDQEDEALLAWTLKRQDALMGRRPDLDTEEAVTTAGFDFVRLRAEAIVLRALGHAAIPLMLKRPTLTVTVEDAVIIHRHFPPELALVHGGEVSTFDYFQDAPTSVDVLTPLRQVHAQIERLRLHIGWMNIDAIAVMFWQRARELASTVKTGESQNSCRLAHHALFLTA